jgi:hypothetical protein
MPPIVNRSMTFFNVYESKGERNTPCSVFRHSAKQESMKLRNSCPFNPDTLIRAAQVAVCLLAVLYLAGCASANYQKADAANGSLQKAAVAINLESRAIDGTMSSLDDLVNKPSSDLKPQFDRFSASLDRLIDSSSRAEKAAAEASRKSEEYFQAWEKEAATINYEAVRDQSVSRKTELSNEFNTVNQRYRENQAVVVPLISYLTDIRTALSTDLTAGGVQSVKPLAENAEGNARKVQAALARLSNDLTASGTGMSSVVLPENQPKGGVGDSTQTTQDHAQSSP